jgi:hypothetical protein
LADPLLFGVLVATDFPRWLVLLLLLLDDARAFLTGLAIDLVLAVADLQRFGVTGVRSLEFADGVRFGVCVALLLILFFWGEVLTGFVDGVVC